MVIDNGFHEKLKLFGLNSYQAKLWTALLSRGVATAGELSDISNVPRSRAYDVLESLEKKGIIVMKIGKPIKYIAVPPNEVVKRVQSKLKVEADNQSKLLDEMKNSDIMSELQVLHTHGIEKIDPTEMTASLRGRTNIYDHISSALENAKESVYICTSDQGLIRKADALKRNLRALKKKGVKIKIAAPINKISKAAADELKEFAEVRNSGDMDSRFVLVDGSNLTFMLVNDKDVNASYDSAIAVKSDFFSKSFKDLFEKKWNDMKEA